MSGSDEPGVDASGENQDTTGSTGENDSVANEKQDTLDSDRDRDASVSDGDRDAAASDGKQDAAASDEAQNTVATTPERDPSEGEQASDAQAVTDRMDTGALQERLDPDVVTDRIQSRGENISRVEAEKAAERARRVGRLMDDAIEIPGIGYRIGLDPLVGIAPVSGDAVAAVASLYIVFEGFRLGVPLRTLLTMLLFIGLDFVLGSIPVLGTVIDAVLKVNKRNAETLESYVESSFSSG